VQITVLTSTASLWQFGATPTILLSGKKLQIKDSADPSKRKLQFSSADAAIDTTAPGGINSVSDGALLHVYNPATGDSACFTLANGNWIAKGSPPSPSFKYADKSFTSSACRTAALKDGKQLKVSCVAKVKPIGFDLNEPTQGSVTVVFGSGATRYCMVFGGAAVKKDAPNVFQAQGAPAPPACPESPALCP
jgi:hypothetical protein